MPDPTPSDTAAPAPHPLRSVHSSNLPGILDQLGISLVVSTYQAGKVILVRNDGGALNTHFRAYEKPMGIAVDGARMDIGSGKTVWSLRNMPAVARKIEPVGKHDAAFLPRRIHVTGDIDIHEMAFAGDGELWLVNTRFGCLCTLDADHSFTPRWRPPFVTAYAPEDRCHLNGLAMVDGQPRYVTALGDTDTKGGWRANKARGGLLMDITTNTALLTGLSMPHSPRWYRDQLFFLESGEGSLARYDPLARSWVTIAQVPGFTRGLDFCGPLAFIGLSQVRESAVFSGIPLVERLKERTCGVWVVNIETGQTVALLRFEEGVQEIFAVQVLHGMRFPDMIEWSDPRLRSSYVLPDAVIADVPPERREPDGAANGAAAAPRDGGFQVHLKRGIALAGEDRWEESARELRRATGLQPDNVRAHNNLGLALEQLNRVPEAIACYERAVDLAPGHARAHLNLGLALLKTGDLPRGFAEFEWRWRTREFTPFVCPQPRWDGRALPGQTVLVHTEQGAGDAIQFVRYLPLVAEQAGGPVLLVAPTPLHRLFAADAGIGELRGPGDIPRSAFQAWAPLMALPGILGTTLDTIPATMPYLQPPADHPLALSAMPGRPYKVGITWAGSATQANDRHRSAPLSALAPVLSVPGVTFFSLQVGPRTGDLAELGAPGHVHDLSGVLGDWADTAAAISQLDLVIGVDTGVVHLAGALGKPVWVLLCFAADWRWMLDRDDSPWYPTARLFRQAEPQAWAPVAERVAEALRAAAQSR